MFQYFFNSINILRNFVLPPPHLYLILSIFPCLFWREQEKQTNNEYYYYYINLNYVEQRDSRQMLKLKKKTLLECLTPIYGVMNTITWFWSLRALKFTFTSSPLIPGTLCKMCSAQLIFKFHNAFTEQHIQGVGWDSRLITWRRKCCKQQLTVCMPSWKKECSLKPLENLKNSLS